MFAEEVADTPQTDIHGLTDCDFCKEKNCEDCEGGKDEPQTEEDRLREQCRAFIDMVEITKGAE